MGSKSTVGSEKIQLETRVGYLVHERGGEWGWGNRDHVMWGTLLTSNMRVAGRGVLGLLLDSRVSVQKNYATDEVHVVFSSAGGKVALVDVGDDFPSERLLAQLMLLV